MARITVEDCIERVTNRFELVLLATRRARQITRGATPLVEVENDKPTVLALREIAEGKIDAGALSEMVDEDTEDQGEDALEMPPSPIMGAPGGE